ncbi:hypothetical protein PFISCL1PPCAC_24282, partial [Pristionchus fissidentatus]
VSEASAIVQPILAKYEELFGKNNLSELVLLYGVDAVLIHRGHEAAYGRDGNHYLLIQMLFLFLAIKSALSSFTQSGPIENKITDEIFEATSDHIVYKAVFHTKITSNGAEFGGKFEQIYRKEGDSWLIIYDEFQS